eukprot:UN00360
MEKRTSILLPRNYLRFPLLKVMVSKIAFLSVFKVASKIKVIF